VALKQFEQLPGHRSLQAPPYVPDALALGLTPSGVGAGVWVVAEPRHHDRVQRPIELPVAAAVQPMPDHLPRGGRDRVGPGQGSERGLRPQPAACNQLTSTWAALIGPTPGSSSSHGARAATSRSSSARSPAASAANSWMRRAVQRNARTVMRCSSEWAGQSRSTAHRRTLLLGRQPAKLGAQLLRRPDDQRLELVGGAHLRGAGAMAGGQQYPQGLPISTTARRQRMLAGQRLTGGPCGVQGVALGATSSGRPLGSADLHHRSPWACRKAASPAP
jgi:hypothetical protein